MKWLIITASLFTAAIVFTLNFLRIYLRMLAINETNEEMGN